MSKSFKKLRDQMSPEAQTKASAKAQEMFQEIEALKELRKARKYSQELLAKNLKTTQANISKIEKRTDIYISTLRSYIESMGGKLEILACFPDGKIKIEQFQDLELKSK